VRSFTETEAETEAETGAEDPGALVESEQLDAQAQFIAESAADPPRVGRASGRRSRGGRRDGAARSDRSRLWKVPGSAERRRGESP
jgi:hypothetical protein